MVIERTAAEFIIKIPTSVDLEGIQRLLDFLVYREATSQSLATQNEVDELVETIKKRPLGSE